MEQIFMIEVYVRKIVLKIEPPEKDEYELREAAEEKRKMEEAAAAAASKPKKKAKKPKKPKKKGKKGKKGKKQPAGPSEEEMKYMQTCTMQMNCLPLFDFYVGHDNFVEPPPPPPPPKKGKKGKKKKKPKKKSKKKKKPVPFKISLPSEPIPQPPFLGVGNNVTFVSRPSELAEMLKKTPVYMTVWNRDQNLNCVGFCLYHWHQSFYECLERAERCNQAIMDQAELRDTCKTEMFTNTVELVRPLQCEEDLKPSGEVELFIRLSCLGNKIMSQFVALPEMDRIPGRKYLVDDLKLKDVEVVRHWNGTTIDNAPPVCYLYGAPDIMRQPIREKEEKVMFEDFVAPFTSSELAILAMGFPKGPCGGVNCPRRMEFRGSEHQFISGENVKGKGYQQGSFVNKRDVHGPCGRLDCPLAKKVRSFICNEGTWKPCLKPCPKDYY